MKSPLILLVEDEMPIRSLFTSFLEGAGYRALQAAAGIEALQLAQTQRPDLVISDVLMPGMDGYELVRRLRAEPLLSAIPVILYSGIFADGAAIHLAKSFGIRHFLGKPISKETFLNSVADALRCDVVPPSVPPSVPPEQLEREHNRVLIDKLTEKINALAASEERYRKMAESAVIHARQQAAVAELGQRALANASLTALFNEAVVLVASGLEVELCKVLELRPDKSALKLIAGVGWYEGLVDQAVVGIGLDSQAGYTLLCENPVIVEDLRTETRFRGPPLLHDHGLVSGISIMIGSPEQPSGVLGAHSRNKRTFARDDANFVQSVANLLGAAIVRHESERSLLDLSGRLLHAEDAERRRVAKELHDSTPQDLVAALMNLKSLRETAAARDPAEATLLEDSLALLENCAHEIRTLSYVLHPPRLDEAGLAGAIRHYAAGFGERTGIATGVDLPVNLDRLGEPVEMVLFRVVQECLGNIHRHAGSATASVCLKHDLSEIVLEVRDEGRGIPPQILKAKPGHFTGLGVGIPGMRERLRQIGGRLEIDSSPSGTTVRAVLPRVAKPLGRKS